MQRSFLRHLVSKTWILFFQNQQAGSTFYFCIIYGAKHNYITLSCTDTSTHQSTQTGNTTKQQINILFVFFSPIFINNVKNHTKLAAWKYDHEMIWKKDFQNFSQYTHYANCDKRYRSLLNCIQSNKLWTDCIC